MGPLSSTALGHQHDPDYRLCMAPSSDRSHRLTTGPLGCSRTPDQGTLEHIPGPDISLDSGSQLAIHISPFFAPLPLQIHLSPWPMNHSALPLFYLPTPNSHHNTAYLPSSWDLDWITGSAWLSTAYPSHKEWCRTEAFPFSCACA